MNFDQLNKRKEFYGLHVILTQIKCPSPKSKNGYILN
jgi:hypothetical protein